MSAPGPDAGASPSALAAAREARGLSPAQAAEQMRLAPETVLAMEEGRFAALGPPVFARGHLRKYAALVGVPADVVLAAYDASSCRLPESTLIPPASAHTPVRSGRVPDLSWRALLVAGAVTLVVVAAGWWYLHLRGTGSKAPVGQGVESVTPPAAGGSVVTGGAVAQPDAVPPAVTSDGQAAPGVPDTSAPAGETGPAPAATSGSLVIEFTGPCWLEVYDAAGGRLAFELVEAGSSRGFAGPGPWKVLLGNVGAARLSVDGDVVQIPAALRVRDAALVSVSDAGEIGPAGAARDS